MKKVIALVILVANLSYLYGKNNCILIATLKDQEKVISQELSGLTPKQCKQINEWAQKFNVEANKSGSTCYLHVPVKKGN